jgi:hypothetical protein
VDIKPIFIIAMCLALCGCFTVKADQPSLQLGFVASIRGNAYLYTTASQVMPMSQIQLQYPGPGNSASCCISLKGGSLDRPDTTAGPASDVITGNTIYRYALKIVPDVFAKTPFVGAAILGDQRVTYDAQSGSEKLVLFDEHSGVARSADICLGTEGANLFLIEKGQIKIQLYYSFGYDVKETCDTKLFQSPRAQ